LYIATVPDEAAAHPQQSLVGPGRCRHRCADLAHLSRFDAAAHKKLITCHDLISILGIVKLSTMNVPLRKPMTLAEFLDWEEQQPLRYKFDGAQPIAITGGTAATPGEQ
jgi:hypothetical protein